MTERSVIALVKKHPGKTSTELAHLCRDKAKDKPMAMNRMLRALAERNRINRFKEHGINPKVTAWRHYPICPVFVPDWLECNEPFTVSIVMNCRPDGVPPMMFADFVRWMGTAEKVQHFPPPAYYDNPNYFADLVIRNLPRMKPDDIKRILVAAAAQRLSQ